MKTEVMANHRCCASCNYWSGDRQLKPNSYGQVFIVDDFYNALNLSGVCRCPQSMYHSQERQPNSVVCNKYSKWYALK